MSETSQKKTATSSSADKSKAKKRDRSASEERLLNAAEDIFSKYGFKASTTRMIAKKANVNESLIGRYFESKTGLLFAVIDHHIKTVHDTDLSYPAQASLTEELLGFMNLRLKEHCQKNEEFFKIVLSQCLVDSKFLKKIRERIPKFQEMRLKERLDKLYSDGKIRKDSSVDEILQGVDVFFHGVMFFEMILNGTPSDVAAKTLKHFIVHYSMAFEA